MKITVTKCVSASGAPFFKTKTFELQSDLDRGCTKFVRRLARQQCQNPDTICSQDFISCVTCDARRLLRSYKKGKSQ